MLTRPTSIFFVKPTSEYSSLSPLTILMARVAMQDAHIQLACRQDLRATNVWWQRRHVILKRAKPEEPRSQGLSSYQPRSQGFSCASVLKRLLVQNLSYEIVFYLNEKKLITRTHIHIEWFWPKTHFNTEVMGNSEMAYTTSQRLGRSRSRLRRQSRRTLARNPLSYQSNIQLALHFRWVWRSTIVL